ncbi:hypothetical protein QQF64_033078 [Cirrhinus molitorella]|uniref:Uncharacterized protein n=1 Tax=Cirrhinus molitorella TaxID=172907 RepID=A0ABR3MT19_9TELE
MNHSLAQEDTCITAQQVKKNRRCLTSLTDPARVKQSVSNTCKNAHLFTDMQESGGIAGDQILSSIKTTPNVRVLCQHGGKETPKYWFVDVVRLISLCVVWLVKNEERH